jgi:hypothetical protein
VSIDGPLDAHEFDSGSCFGGNRATATPVIQAKSVPSRFKFNIAYKVPTGTGPLQPSNKFAALGPSTNRQPQLDALAARQYPASKQHTKVTNLFEDDGVPVGDSYAKQSLSKASTSLSIPESLWSVNW